MRIQYVTHKLAQFQHIYILVGFTQAIERTRNITMYYANTYALVSVQYLHNTFGDASANGSAKPTT